MKQKIRRLIGNVHHLKPGPIGRPNGHPYHKNLKNFMVCLLFTLMVAGSLIHFNEIQVNAATEITDVDITIAPPIEGRTVSFEAYATEGNGYLVFSDYSNSQGFHSGISWFDITSGEFLQEGDTFSSGHEYRVSIAVLTENKS